MLPGFSLPTSTLPHFHTSTLPHYLRVMLGKLTGWDDTIVALATAPGIGALGVIRLSGPKAIEIANGLFHSKDLSLQPSHTLHIGLLKNGDEILDEVVVSIY